MGDDVCDGAGGVTLIEPGGGGNNPVEVPVLGFDFGALSFPSFFCQQNHYR